MGCLRNEKPHAQENGSIRKGLRNVTFSKGGGFLLVLIKQFEAWMNVCKSLYGIISWVVIRVTLHVFKLSFKLDFKYIGKVKSSQLVCGLIQDH